MVDHLEDLAGQWDTALQAEQKSPNTIRTYLNAIRVYLAWADQQGRPVALDRQSVAAFTAESLARGVSPATANVRHRALRRFAGWLTDEDLIPVNPLSGMRQPKIDQPVVPKLSDEEMAALVDACKGKDFRDRRDEALVRFMAETGVRAAEALALTVGDVDPRRGVAVITRGKGGTGRVVPFSATCGVALDRYLRLRQSHPLAGTGVLWLGERRRGLSYDGLYTALRKRAGLAGIKDFHPHRLRHTAASRWLARGGSEGGLMAVAGWRSRDMLDRYVQGTASERATDESRRLGLGDF